MAQFYVVEIKKNIAGEFEHQVYWLYDEDAGIAQRKGESKFYDIMKDAALIDNTDYAMHSAILFSSESFPLINKAYFRSTSAPAEEPAAEE